MARPDKIGQLLSGSYIDPDSKKPVRVETKSLIILPTLIVGNGALRYQTAMAQSLEETGLSIEWASEQLAQPSANVLALIAVERALLEKWQTAGELQALYLRAPDAEINWLTRSEQTRSEQTRFEQTRFEQTRFAV